MPNVRDQVKARDTHCWHCGTDQDLVPHHRMNRGSGGRKSLDRIDNLILVCARYNGLMESDAAVAVEARDLGHKLASWDDFSHPVFDQAELTWWTLTEDGSKIRTDAPSYLI